MRLKDRIYIGLTYPELAMLTLLMWVLIRTPGLRKHLVEVLPIYLAVAYSYAIWVFITIAALSVALLFVLTAYAIYLDKI